MKDKGSRKCKHIHLKEWLRVDGAKILASKRSFIVGNSTFTHILDYMGMHKVKIEAFTLEK